jgi:predicted transglutaminase-like cysteine proteinase
MASLVVAARGAPKIEQLRLVNASLNERIRYQPDNRLSGDHWSTVRETLGRSAGDCEDFAIAKLQALEALGVPEGDLFMTIGHEGSPDIVHAVLVARVGREFLVLDNRTNRLIPQEQFSGFYPIITFGARSSWLHGYAKGKMPAAVRATRVALQSNRK